MFLGQWNWERYIAAADMWPTADVGNEFRTPVPTNIPVIFADGDWDTQTPVENTIEIAKSFPKSRVIICEHGGHGVLEPIAVNSSEVWGQLIGFLRTGELPEVPQRLSLPMPAFAVPDFPPSAAK